MASKRRSLRSVDGMVAPNVAETIEALSLDADDAGLVSLARQYAEEIDAHGPGDERRAAVLRLIGPKLVDVLDRLDGRSRRRASSPGRRSKLSALREARPPGGGSFGA